VQRWNAGQAWAGCQLSAAPTAWAASGAQRLSRTPLNCRPCPPLPSRPPACPAPGAAEQAGHPARVAAGPAHRAAHLPRDRDALGPDVRRGNRGRAAAPGRAGRAAQVRQGRPCRVEAGGCWVGGWAGGAKGGRCPYRPPGPASTSVTVQRSSAAGCGPWVRCCPQLPPEPPLAAAPLQGGDCSRRRRLRQLLQLQVRRCCCC
jgi:hypothetical protein